MPATVDQELCTACNSCVEVCPSSAIEIPEAYAVVKPDDCIDCNACADACTTNAISMTD
jgi:NAD-dependent dihydropyrimidine dehydrogenase PreA subunit